MPSPFVVMIATSNRPDLLRRTLASLGKCEKPEDYRETVVVENGSKSGTEEVVQEAAAWLRVRYLFESKPNKSAALNRGLSELDDCLVFFTDDDTRFHASVLCAYKEVSERFGKGNFYGGPTEADYEIEPAVWLKEYLPPSARGWRLGEALEPLRKPDFLGFNWAAFASDLKAVGGFDPNRGPGSPTGSVGQEKEMQQRLLKEELKAIYVPEALVWHYVPKERCSAKWVLKRSYQSGIQAGIEQFSFNSEASRLFGYPRWAVREWIGKACTALLSITTRDATLRFDALYQYKYFSGLLRGMRVARKIASKSSNSHPSKPAVSMSPKVLSIIITTRNRASALRQCLQSLQACDTTGDWPVEIIVVDNGSDDDTRELVNNFAVSSRNPVFRYLYEARQGKSYAVNTGFDSAQGSIIAFADDDVVVDKAWLVSIVDEFRREQELGILTGRVESLDESGSRVAVTRSSIEKTLDCNDSLDGLILGCNLAVRREVFSKVSGRDTRLGPGRGLSCEDIDFTYRVLKAGFRGRFSPRPVVYHAPGLRNRSTEYLRGWGAFYLKYLLQGDRRIVRKAWWEIRRILREFRTSPGRSPLNELFQMLIGALIMAQRLTLSLFHRDPARASVR